MAIKNTEFSQKERVKETNLKFNTTGKEPTKQDETASSVKQYNQTTFIASVRKSTASKIHGSCEALILKLLDEFP